MLYHARSDTTSDPVGAAGVWSLYTLVRDEKTEQDPAGLFAKFASAKVLNLA